MLIKKFLHSGKAGFTMIEVMIVVAIIGILMSFGMLPYKDYMDRAELTNTVDLIGQEWILAHKEIRNGLETKTTTGSTHSAIIFHFKKGETKINKYKIDWNLVAENNADNGYIFKNQSDIGNVIMNLKNPTKTINFSKDIEIKNDFLVNGHSTEDIYYVIIPPLADGKFFTNNGTEISITQSEIKIGYKNTQIPTDPNIKTPKIKTVLLRPYLQ